MHTYTASYKELLAQREALEQQITAARNTEVADAVQIILELVEAFALTPKDVFPTVTFKHQDRVVAPKYRDPTTGQTWTGRGRVPRWINNKDRSQFAI